MCDDAIENLPFQFYIGCTHDLCCDELHQFRYDSALREINNLRILNDLRFSGAPVIYGSCIEKDQVIYAVTRFSDSRKMCQGSGTDLRCAMAQDMVMQLKKSMDQKTEALKFLQKVSHAFFHP